MKTRLLISVILCGINSLFPAAANDSKVYATGEAIIKPMILSRFIELHNARRVADVDFLDRQLQPVSLKQFRGKLVIVNVWATWCAPCLREIPAMASIQQNNLDKPLVVVPLSIDENVAEVGQFLKKHQFSNYQTWLDPQKNIEQIMPANVVPATYVFDGAGNLIGFVRGYLDWNDEKVQPFLEALTTKYAGK
jgi:thiol-disulfide isomerase/thioredoxin